MLLSNILGFMATPISSIGTAAYIAKEKVKSNVSYGTHLVAAGVYDFKESHCKKENKVANEEAKQPELKPVTEEDLNAIMNEKVKVANETIKKDNNIIEIKTTPVKENTQNKKGKK